MDDMLQWEKVMHVLMILIPWNYIEQGENTRMESTFQEAHYIHDVNMYLSLERLPE